MGKIIPQIGDTITFTDEDGGNLVFSVTEVNGYCIMKTTIIENSSRYSAWFVGQDANWSSHPETPEEWVDYRFNERSFYHSVKQSIDNLLGEYYNLA